MERKDFSEVGKKLALLQRENFTKPLTDSMNSFLQSFDNMLDTFGGPNKKWDMREKTFKSFSEIMQVYSFGFFESTLVLCGRTLEGTIADYLKFLKKTKKVSYKLIEIDSWSLENKINILYKANQ